MDPQLSQEAGNENSSSVDEVDNDFNAFLQADANILGNILPPNVWDYISSKLLDSEMRDMSNSSPYFRSLLLPQRTNFLLPDIIKPLCEQLEKIESKEPVLFVKRQHDQEGNQELYDAEGYPEDEDEFEKVKNPSGVLKCRQISKSWNHSIDQYIQATSVPQFFDIDLPSPNKRALAHATYTYFGQHSWELDQFMAHFRESHTLLDRERNPFIGHLLVIHIPYMIPEGPSLLQLKIDVLLFLRQYGQHIRILNINLPCTDIINNHFWLTEFLSMVPNLTHLKVSSGALALTPPDMQFGEHIYHPELNSTSPDDPAERRRRERRELEVQALENEHRQFLPTHNPIPNNFEEVLLANIEDKPLPYLKCLKLCNLPAITFNTLIQTYRHVEWLHIQRDFRERQNYVDWRQLEFPNLKTFYIQLNSHLESVQLLSLSRSRWSTLTHVHLEYSWKAEFVKWCPIFKAIEEIWGNTLVELKLRLPRPYNFLDRFHAMRAAVEYRLTLPKLKRLKIWIWNSDEFNAPIHFLEPVMKLPGLEFKRYDSTDDH